MKYYVKEVREKRGLTQIELANMLGVSKSYICRIESGDKGISFDFATSIANKLDVSLDELAGRELRKFQ